MRFTEKERVAGYIQAHSILSTQTICNNMLSVLVSVDL